MTRLQTKDIHTISSTLEAYDQEVLVKTGKTLKELAIDAAEVQKSEVYKAEMDKADSYKPDNNGLEEFKVGIIPITSGLGVINGFSESVQSIVRHLGFDTFVTTETDVAGIAEATRQGANILMMADDYNFVAINLETKKVVDNGEATACGFVAALEAMLQGLSNKKVLLVGAGEVGSVAAELLVEKDAMLSVFDINQKAANRLADTILQKYKQQITIEVNLEEAISKYAVVFDACPLGGFIRPEHVETISAVAAPGVPLCLASEVVEVLKEKIIHDPLQLGVATMLMKAVSVS